MTTLFERVDSQKNVWYWVEGEDDTIPFYEIPDCPRFYATEQAVFHKDFTKFLWTSIALLSD